MTAKDAVLNLLAEQNMDLMEEVVHLKRDLKGAFEQIDIDMTELKEEANRKEIDQTEALRALTSKLENFENNSKFSFISLSSKIDTIPSQPSNSHPSAPSTSPQSAATCPPPATAPTSISNKKKSEYLTQPKVLLVDDSIGSNLQMNRVERSQKIRIKSATPNVPPPPLQHKTQNITPSALRHNMQMEIGKMEIRA